MKNNVKNSYMKSKEYKYLEVVSEFEKAIKAVKAKDKKDQRDIKYRKYIDDILQNDAFELMNISLKEKI